MQEQNVIHNTFVIERSYPVTAERVFSAFCDPAKKRRWILGGGGHEVEQFAMDFRTGGKECARVRLGAGTPVAGMVCTNDTFYQDIVPNRRIVYTSTMTLGEKRISVSLCTFEFPPAEAGTDLIFTHQAAFFEGADGPAMREGGWRTLFERLTDEIKQA